MQSVKKNFLYQSFWQILLMILPFVTSPYIARVLGAENAGIYSYTYSIISYFTMVACLGIDKYGNRTIAQHRNNKNELSRVFCEMYGMHLIIAFGVCIIYYIYAFFFAEYKIIALIQGFYLLSTTITFTWFFAGIEEFKMIVVRDSIIKIITVVLTFIVVRSSHDLWKYTLMLSASNLVSACLFFFFLKKYIYIVHPSLSSMLQHLKPLFILFIPVALESIYNVMDKIMLKSLVGVKAVGFYEYANKALIAKSLVFSLGTVLLPKMSNLIQNKDRNKAKEYLVKTTEITMVLSIGLGLGTAGIAKEFSPLFWGEEFMPCANLITIMAITIPFQALSNEVRTLYLIPSSRDKDYMLAAGAGAISDFLLNLIVIPIYGAAGAALATLVSEVLVLVTQLLVIRNRLNMWTYIKQNLFYILPGIIMYLLIRMVGNYGKVSFVTLGVEFIVGSFCYSIICIMYWKKKNNEYFLGIINKLLKRS